MPAIGPSVVGLPGIRAIKTATPRQPFRQIDLMAGFASGKVIDGSKSRDAGNTGDVDRLRAGKLMGRITSGSKYRPSWIGVTPAISAATVTSITGVAAAVVTEFARLIALAGGNVSAKITGPPTAAGTVATTAITVEAASGTTLTVSSVALPAYIAGSYFTPADGSETIRTLTPGPWPLEVTDSDGSSLDVQFPDVPMAGVIQVDQIIDYPTDTSLITYVKNALNAVGKYVFSDDY